MISGAVVRQSSSSTRVREGEDDANGRKKEKRRGELGAVQCGDAWPVFLVLLLVHGLSF